MILYTANWCSKCRLIKKFVKDTVKIVEVDKFTWEEIEKIGLKALPTLQTDDGKLHNIQSAKDLIAFNAKI